MRSYVFGFVCCCLIAVSTAADPPASDTGVFNNEVRFAPGASEADVLVYTTAAGASGAPSIDDQMNAAEGQPKITWTLAKEVARSTTGTGASAVTRIDWLFHVRAENPAANTSVARVAQLSAGDARRLIVYTLTNRPKSFTWSITAPQPSVVVPRTDNVTFFAAMTGDSQPAVEVSIARTTLQDDAGQSLDSNAFSLVTPGSKTKTAMLAAGSVTPLMLKIDPTKLANGKYTGSIDLAATGSTDTKSFALTVSRSSTCARLLGVALIFLGVVVSVGVGVFARNASARAQALAPAARLLAILTAIEAKLRTCLPVGAPSLQSALKRVGVELSTGTLRIQGYISSFFGSPLRVSTAPSDYAAYLQLRSDALKAYGYLTEQFCKLQELKTKKPPATAAEVKAYDDALIALDDIAKTPPPYDMTVISQQVNTVFATLTAAMPAAALGGGTPSTGTSSMQHLLFVIDVLNAGAWVIWAAITTVTGAAALVFSNTAFGTPLDFVKAFLWGVGVQVAGQQLQQLLPANVSTALGITLPSNG